MSRLIEGKIGAGGTLRETGIVRRIVIALGAAAAVAALIAAAVFAADPPADPGLFHASDVSGKVVPVQAGLTEEGADESETEPDGSETEPDETPTEDETVENQNQADGHCSTDPTTAPAEQLAALNHGAIVCWAAHQDPPEGVTHGAWVSSWARQNHGHDDADDGEGFTDDGATEESTDTTAASAAHGHGKPDHAGKPRKR